jgi:hypothetical protein
MENPRALSKRGMTAFSIRRRPSRRRAWRTSPLQKQQIVQALRHQGNDVAMVADWVNAVLSLAQEIAVDRHSGTRDAL